ncbi:MAG: hypothetical protein N3G20_07215, partial [Verrucomicrobiae bacterium]|nr:hypothetical protein [Verrucomicrobiae bacterium]
GDRVLEDRALMRRELALEVLGEHLSTVMPGAFTVVVGNPFAKMRGQAAQVRLFEEAAVKGLRRGAGGRLRIAGVEHPELSAEALRDPSSVPIPPDATTPLSFMWIEGAWDRVLSRYPETALVVSLVGVPADVHRLEAWQGGRVKFAFLLPDFRVLGDREAVIGAFKSGKIVAAVINHPTAPPESEPVVRDRRKEFERRFILVTVDNCEAVLSALLR